MIIEPLVRRYENLVYEGKLPLKGWSNEKISYGIKLNASGEITQIVDLRTTITKGKREITTPIIKMLPERVERSNNLISNFLYDNVSYLLGVDAKGDLQKSISRFQAAKEKHLNILKNCNSEPATAVKNFFETWNPSYAYDCEAIKGVWDDIQAINLIFMVGDLFAIDDSEIKTAYTNYLNDVQNNLEENKKMRCLITGKIENIARTHPAIKGIAGTPSSGGKIVSFNKDSPCFESLGKIKAQGFNAPISQYVAFAYTTALNNLLQDKKHIRRFSDTTILYWADKSEDEYQSIVDYFLIGDNGEINEQILKDTWLALEKGECVYFNGKELNSNEPFYILALSPNSARISIRFFLEATLGEILRNIICFHKDMEIVSPKNKFIPLFKLEDALISSKAQNRDLFPAVACAILKSIFYGTDFPKSFLANAIQRTYLEQDSKKEDKKLPNYKISSVRCAMIKAYLIRNQWRDITVALNEEEKDTAYVLGRIFAVLETIQKKSNPDITIKDRYFNSFCAMPNKIFPILNKNSQYHLKKLKGGLKIYYEKILRDLMCKLDVANIPKIMPLEKQGMVILGYYHQVQSLYTKKEDAQNE